MVGLLNRLALASLSALPGPLMRAVALRYIAGERLEDALERLRALAADGFGGILDLLGEDIADETAARAVARCYREAATAAREAEIDAYLSVKPTHVGLRLSEELAYELFAELVRHCDTLGSFVRVEMEDHTTTDGTLRLYERLRPLSERVGIVLQSRLLRTPDDIEALVAPAAERRPLNVRMVKGVYLEPPSIAHVEPEPIRCAYVDCSRRLFERGAFVALATHDDVMAERLVALCREMELGPERYELEVLLGVRERLWRRWQDAGLRVRVYVPYGPEWRAYSTRRLRKNPQIFRHVLRDLVRRR